MKITNIKAASFLTFAIAGVLAQGEAAVTLVTYIPTGSAASSPNNTPLVASETHSSVTASVLAGVRAGDLVAPDTLFSGANGPLRTNNGGGSTWTFGDGAWLYVNANSDGSGETPSSTDDFFTFTLTSNAGSLKLDTLSFDYAYGRNSDPGAITSNHRYALFASADDGAFQQIGSTFSSGDVLLANTGVAGSGKLDFDLSPIANAEKVEFRIWVSTTASHPGSGSIFRNIQVTGIPEPSSTLLVVLSGLIVLRRRR